MCRFPNTDTLPQMSIYMQILMLHCKTFYALTELLYMYNSAYCRGRVKASAPYIS